MTNGIQEEGGGIVLMDLVEVIRRRWLWHVIGAATGVTLAVGLLSTKDPSYRAEATLRLEQEGSGAGILSDLAALTQAPVAISEMEVLRSRAVAGEVVAPPAAGLPSLAPDSAESLDTLGLTTIVDDPALRPLDRITSRFTGGASGPKGAQLLAAAGVLPEGEPGPYEIQVHFPSQTEVEVSSSGLLGSGAAETVSFVPGEPFQALGTTLVLAPTIDPTGRTWRITLFSEADAIDRVQKALRVQETDRNSGVLRLTYDDTDPVRAARTANALCRRYLARNLESSQRRASRTVGYIETSLEHQIELLRAAEADVVELKSQGPEFIDVGETAKALIEELSSLEVRRMEGRLTRAGLEEAVALLDAGDVAALSRLGPEVADPVVLGYVESIVRLNAEAELLERRDSGAYKALLQSHGLELRARRDAAELRLGTLRAITARLEKGDMAALGQLDVVAQAGTGDPIITALVEQWTANDGRLRRLEIDFKDELPEIRSLRKEQAALMARFGEVVGARVGALTAQVSEYDALLDQQGTSIDALPGEERGRIEGAVDRLREKAKGHLEARLAGLVAHGEQLDARIEEFGARLAELPEHERALATPMRAAAAHGEIVQLLMMRQQEAEITRAASLASAEFIDVAIPPRRPRGPSLPMHVLLGFALGMGAATALSLLRESQASGVFTSAELESSSGLPVVATIPAFPKNADRNCPPDTGFVPLRDEPAGAAAEAFRALRSNLKFLIRSKEGGSTLAVTSSGPAEGKSMTNIDVALSFAMAGKRVLLVDADMRRGSVSQYLGIPRTPGLSEVLQGSAGWRECLVDTFAESLHVLPAGSVPASPGDLLAGPRTAAIVDEMRDSFDLVVLDVAPVLAVADIECLAAQLDTVLLLCRSSKTTDAQVRDSVTRLRQVGANVVATVLNGVKGRRGDYGYGYGYGYGTESRQRDSAA